MSKYFDIHSILADETVIPVKFTAGATRLGLLINGKETAGEADLLPGTTTDIPLWLCNSLAPKELLTVRSPNFFGDRMQRKLLAGADCENLKARCPYFYQVAQRYHNLVPEIDKNLAPTVFVTFRNRFYKLAGAAMGLDGSEDAAEFAMKLSSEEMFLFEGARLAAVQGETWKFDHSVGVATFKKIDMD